MADLRITLSAENSPELPAIGLEAHELGTPQWPTTQAVQYYETILNAYVTPSEPTAVTITPEQKANILSAFQLVMDAVNAQSVDSILSALSNFRMVMNDNVTDPFLRGALQATAVSVACLLVCPPAPRRPPPGSVVWLLTGWFPCGIFDGRVYCIYVCGP
jgi:hypothetical protein